MRYPGSCHCDAVRFDIELDDDEVVDVRECNCSICAMTGFLHVIAPASRFRLLAGAGQLTAYRFNTGVAKHTFCARCGVKPFYVPRSNPDGISVNLRCLRPRPPNVAVQPFDGQNWERHAAELTHLSDG